MSALEIAGGQEAFHPSTLTFNAFEMRMQMQILESRMAEQLIHNCKLIPLKAP